MIPDEFIICSLLFNSIISFILAKLCFNLLCNYEFDEHDERAMSVGMAGGILGTVLSALIGFVFLYLTMQMLM